MPCSITILAVDDEQDFLDSIKRALVGAGFQPPVATTSPHAAASLFDDISIDFDVALLDMSMPGMSGEELLETIRRKSPDTECIMITAVDDAETAVRCLKKGAYEYLVKPIAPSSLINTLKRTLERKRLLDLVEIKRKDSTPALKCDKAFRTIITKSRTIFKVLKEAELHAMSDVPILITGESGTGKELLARAIHEASPRAKNSYMAVNMAAMNNTLFDAEFYGHTKGAFTGAAQNRKGYLEHADRGTLFLDEIGSTPLEIQGKLLRFLQEGEYLKLGTSQTCRANVRVITATNVDIDTLLSEGKFRNDFYYRLKGAWLHLPPLRERKGDIPLLVKTFIKEFTSNGSDGQISEKAMSRIMAYNFPGNVRELKYVIQGALNLAGSKPILPDHLPPPLNTDWEEPEQMADTIPPTALAEVERNHIVNVYHLTGRNKAQTARILGIGLNTLRRKLKSYGEPLH